MIYQGMHNLDIKTEKKKMKNIKTFEDFTQEPTNESEGYIEVMDEVRIANGLGEIQQAWAQWKSGPATEPRDINPAKKELKGWIDRWFKDNIK
jgi:hypothetical protein